MTASGFEHILLDIDDGIATVTLNRPDKLNAMSERMRLELMAALDHTDADDDVRAVIFTGAGRGYCAGADLSRGASTFDYTERVSGDAAAGADEAAAKPAVQRDGGGELTLRIYDSIKPIIGAINGAAVGVGVTMTLPMDVRLASTEAKFGFVFARRGIVPEACSSWFLPRVVGISQALEWAYSGRVFPAAEAHEAGLVRSVHAPDDLLPAARELARSFADETSALSVSTTRQMLWRMLGADHPMEAHKVDSRMVQELGAGPDAAEGVSSFLEKRPAEFRGKPSSQLPPSMPWWDERPFE